MNVSSAKKNITIIFFILAIIILAANLIFDKLYDTKTEKTFKIKSELNSEEIQSRFETALFNLGIEKDWIKKNDINFYKVKVPKDLPITEILNEIDNLFYNSEASISSHEKKINGQTNLNISVERKIKLQADFYYDDSIERNAGSIGIFISGLENLNDDKIKEVLNVPESFSILLVPSKKSIDILKKLNYTRGETGRSNKNYSILLNDEINDLEFKLDKDYSPARLKNSIRNIIGKFPQTDFFIVDDKSNLYSSSIFPFIKKEFDKRKINLIHEDSLNNFDKSTLQKNFLDEASKIKRGMNAEIILTAEEFLSLQNEIIKLEKVGYKFVKAKPTPTSR